VLVYLKPNSSGSQPEAPSWISALALFTYAAGFSWAYVLMPAANGALILFGAVQITMVITGLVKGEKLYAWQWLGFCLAALGMALLTLPTFSTPSGVSAIAMILAGVAWGFYSLLGRQTKDPLKRTADNFLKTLPMAAALALLQHSTLQMNLTGLTCALLAGALTSGIGYAIWYLVLPTLRATDAAGIQLSVPVITVILGALLLQEAIALNVILSCATILGGMAMVLWGKPKLSA
jgi:drug/metabolite transporter (DMT)-like permease